MINRVEIVSPLVYFQVITLRSRKSVIYLSSGSMSGGQFFISFPSRKSLISVFRDTCKIIEERDHTFFCSR